MKQEPKTKKDIESKKSYIAKLAGYFIEILTAISD